MRVLGGEARGRRLKPVPGLRTRPPLGRVKQALFDILMPATAGSAWLDLFAGTGSYGIEALSRGAREVVMVELDGRAVATIKRNLGGTGVPGRVTVIRGDVLREVPRLARRGARFDVVTVAPPYFRGLGPRVLGLIDETGLLTPGGRVVVQRHRSEELPAVAGALTLVRDYRYGETILSLYQRETGPA